MFGERIRGTLSRARHAAIGAAVGAFVGGLISREAASTGGAVGALAGAVIGETRFSAETRFEEVRQSGKGRIDELRSKAEDAGENAAD